MLLVNIHLRRISTYSQFPNLPLANFLLFFVLHGTSTLLRWRPIKSIEWRFAKINKL